MQNMINWLIFGSIIYLTYRQAKIIHYLRCVEELTSVVNELLIYIKMQREKDAKKQEGSDNP